MAELDRGAGGALHYQYAAPSDGACSFVFVNALTGSTAAWESEIAPSLRERGYGTLAYDMRGQGASRTGDGDRLDEALILDDLKALMAEVAPPRPVLVGLSIGGLFAAKAICDGLDAEGLVLINTLRRPTLALEWTNEAMTRAAALGGGQLVMDMFLPFLVGPDLLARQRDNCLSDAGYTPPAADDPVPQLLANARAVDWNFPYEELDLPVLVMSGLRDRVFYHAPDVADLLARLPDAREVTFSDAGHLIPMERGARTADELDRFARETLSLSPQ